MVRTKVFVGNLSFQIKDTELATEFGAAGKVIGANIITRGPRSLGYGFVEMDSEQDADNAVKVMNKKEINGRPINVEIAKPQDETKERAPRQNKEGGENNEENKRRPRRRNSNQKRNQGEGEESEGGKAEVGEKKEEGSPSGDRPKRQRRKRRTHNNNNKEGGEQRKRIPDEQKEESKTTLFVANLPFSLGNDEFAKVVTEQGLKLKTAHVVKKRNGRSKGYGFIDFETQEEQQKALVALNKKQVEGRELSVKVALTEIKKETEEAKEVKEVKETKDNNKAPPPEKKAIPVEKKATPPEKKAIPVEKKAIPVEKKATPPEKKAAVPTEKKSTPPPEKKASPAEKKTSSPSEKKTSAPSEKKEEKV